MKRHEMNTNKAQMWTQIFDGAMIDVNYSKR